MTTVVCVNHGNYLGRGDEYVSKLRRGVERHLTIPHHLECLTEQELGTELSGWWCKMHLFRPGMFDGPVLYLDLDVILTANIDHLVTLAATDESKLWMRDDFSYSVVTPKRSLDADAKRFLGGDGCCNSSVMLWHSQDVVRPIWDAWTMNSERYMRDMHGDQNCISHVMWPDHIRLLPNDSIHSYKYHVREGKGLAPIVVMHGSPKCHEIREPWVREHWS